MFSTPAPPRIGTHTVTNATIWQTPLRTSRVRTTGAHATSRHLPPRNTHAGSAPSNAIPRDARRLPAHNFVSRDTLWTPKPLRCQRHANRTTRPKPRYRGHRRNTRLTQYRETTMQNNETATVPPLPTTTRKRRRKAEPTADRQARVAAPAHVAPAPAPAPATAKPAKIANGKWAGRTIGIQAGRRDAPAHNRRGNAQPKAGSESVRSKPLATQSAPSRKSCKPSQRESAGPLETGSSAKPVPAGTAASVRHHARPLPKYPACTCASAAPVPSPTPTSTATSVSLRKVLGIWHTGFGKRSTTTTNHLPVEVGETYTGREAQEHARRMDGRRLTYQMLKG